MFESSMKSCQLTVLLAVLLALPGCGPTAAAPTMPQQLPTVTISQPIKAAVTEYIDFTGRTEGSQLVQLRSLVSGELISSSIKPGRFIPEQAVLFQIDKRPFEAAEKRAAAAVERTDATLKRLMSEVRRAATNLEATSITQEAYDKVFYDYKEAKATHDGAVAELDRARLDMSWTTIKSPIAGIVSEDFVKPGNLVTANDTLLTTIIKQDPIYVYYDMDEQTVKHILDLIRTGKFKSARSNTLPVRVSLGSQSEFPFPGRVTFVDNALDPTTGTMRIRAEVDNPLLANESVAITPGMFARVRIMLGEPTEEILIGERAIQFDQDLRYVLIVNEQNQVEKRYIKLGGKFGHLRAITDGLSTADRVIVNGMHSARPGREVKFQEVPMPGGEDAQAFALNPGDYGPVTPDLPMQNPPAKAAEKPAPNPALPPMN
jgi:RND family efflux transporter MFP subunit